MKKVCLAVVLLGALAAVGLAQAKVDGKWTAEVPGGRGGTQQITFNFKTDGSKLTGTATAGQAGEAPIEDGKIEGDTISFKQTLNFNGNSVSISYTGKVKGDEIEFTREGGGGGGGNRGGGGGGAGAGGGGNRGGGGGGGGRGGPATFTAKRAS